MKEKKLPKGWKVVKIEVCIEFIRNGRNCDQLDEGKYPITRIETIWNGTIDQERVKYCNPSDDELDKYKLINGDILFSHINSPTHIGKTAIYKGVPRTLIHGINLLLLRPQKSIIHPEFLNYFFKSSETRKYFETRCKKAVNQASLNQKDIKEIEILVPPVEVQQKIAYILVKAEEAIEKRKETIRLLDELVKSRFIEMFGDPIKNTKEWKVKRLKEIILLANNGLARRGNDKDGNIVLRLVELQDGYIDYTTPNRIKLTEEEQKRYLLKDGDFLFARVNGNPNNVGRCASYKEVGEPVYHNDHIIRVRFNNNIVNNDYVSTILNSPYGKLQMKDKIKTSAGQYTINQNGIADIKMIIPPIELQNEFADFINQVDKLKVEMENSLKELENNFNSLMQKAFNGELFN